MQDLHEELLDLIISLIDSLTSLDSITSIASLFQTSTRMMNEILKMKNGNTKSYFLILNAYIVSKQLTVIKYPHPSTTELDLYQLIRLYPNHYDIRETIIDALCVRNSIELNNLTYYPSFKDIISKALRRDKGDIYVSKRC